MFNNLAVRISTSFQRCVNTLCQTKHVPGHEPCPQKNVRPPAHQPVFTSTRTRVVAREERLTQYVPVSDVWTIDASTSYSLTTKKTPSATLSPHSNPHRISVYTRKKTLLESMLETETATDEDETLILPDLTPMCGVTVKQEVRPKTSRLGELSLRLGRESSFRAAWQTVPKSRMFQTLALATESLTGRVRRRVNFKKIISQWGPEEVDLSEVSAVRLPAPSHTRYTGLATHPLLQKDDRTVTCTSPH